MSVSATSNEGTPRTKPTSTVPFERNQEFIDRDDLFTKIDISFKQFDVHNHIALCGPGGIGKSQIAIEYAHRTRQKTPDTCVFWVCCSTFHSFQNSFLEIAQQLRLSGFSHPETDILELVYRWLDDEGNGRWLLILDNADNTSALAQRFAGPESRSLYSFVPLKGHGDVLITVRDRVLALGLVEDFANVINVGSMTETQALALLRAEIHITSDRQLDVVELIKLLEYLPLAITQAAAYIRQMQPLSISEYVAELRSNCEERRTTMLPPEIANFFRYNQVPSAIFMTWQLVFTHLQTNHADAYNLLCLLATYHSRDVPRGLVAEEHELVSFRKNSYILKKFSLITIHDSENISMHGIVQRVVRGSMLEHGTSEIFGVEAISRLNSKLQEYNRGLLEYTTRVAPIPPHVGEFTWTEFEDLDCEMQRGEIFTRIITLPKLSARPSQPNCMVLSIVEITDRFEDTTDPRVVMLRLEAVKAYIDLGQFQDARLLFDWRMREGFGSELTGQLTFDMTDALVQCDLGEDHLDQAENLGTQNYQHVKTLEPLDTYRLMLAEMTLATVFLKKYLQEPTGQYVEISVDGWSICSLDQVCSILMKTMLRLESEDNDLNRIAETLGKINKVLELMTRVPGPEHETVTAVKVRMHEWRNQPYSAKP